MKSDFTVGQVASELQVCTRTVRRYLKDGRFPNAYRLGGSDVGEWRVPRIDVDAYKHARKPSSRRRRVVRDP